MQWSWSCTAHGFIPLCEFVSGMEYAGSEGDIPDVAIVYVSSYGYTKKMAEKIAEGIRAAGISEVECLDLEVIGQDAAKEKISQASGFLLGSPTMVGDALTPVWQVLTAINPIIHKGKFAGAFGSYAWGGEGVPNLIERMGQLNLKLPMEGLRIKLNPSEEQLRQAFAYGEGFAMLSWENKNA